MKYKIKVGYADIARMLNVYANLFGDIFNIITHALDAMISGKCGQNMGTSQEQGKENPRNTNVSKDFILLS